MDNKILATYDGFILDLDGTVYLGNELIPGALETIEYLKANNKKVLYLTNKPLETREQYANKLTELGIPTKPDEILTSSVVMAHYLNRQSSGPLVYVIGEQPLIDELQLAGIKTIQQPELIEFAVDYVVVAFDRTFDYKKLNNGFQAIKKGARFVATNGDRTCPVPGGEIPDCAAMIGALEGATGKKVEIIVGKPHRLTIEAALSLLKVEKERAIIIGDRIETDILMGKNAGIASALVLTGITKKDDFSKKGITYRPTYILDSIKQILTAG